MEHQLYMVWDKNNNNIIYKDLRATTAEYLKRRIRDRLRNSTYNKLWNDHEMIYGVANARKIKDILDVMTTDEMLDYCNYEIREPGKRKQYEAIKEDVETLEIYKTCKHCGEYYKTMCYCWRDETL